MSQITVKPYLYDDTQFLEGDIDVTVSFAAGSLLPLMDQIGDRELNIIWPDDYGVHFYSDTIIVNDALVDETPDLVRRFLSAVLREHQFAIENPEIAVDASMAYSKIQDREIQADMFNASDPLIHTGDDQVGWMRASVWDGMANILTEQGILSDSVDVDGVYTLQFLQSVYGEME